MKRVLVVGAAGDVGAGIVCEAIAAGWQVIAAGRSGDKLDSLLDRQRSPALKTVVGDLGSEIAAGKLWQAAAECFGGIDCAIISVNAPNRSRPLLDWTAEELLDLFAANVTSHFNAAKIFVPQLPVDGVFVGIGGGMADFLMRGMAHLSIAQAALRMMYRGIATERRGAGCAIRELMIVSMVNGASVRENADPAWLTDREIGRHLCAILDTPERFAGPILTLSTRDQIARADAVA